MDLIRSLLSWQTIVENLLWLVIIGPMLIWGWRKFLSNRSTWLFWLLSIATTLVLVGVIISAGSRSPILAGTIDAIYVGSYTGPGVEAPATSVILVAGIRNLGSPSVAEGWRLEIYPDDESEPYIGEPYYIPDTLNVSGESGEIVYRAADALYQKAVERPIPTGGMVRGGVVVCCAKSAERDAGTSKHEICTAVQRHPRQHLQHRISLERFGQRPAFLSGNAPA